MDAKVLGIWLIVECPHCLRPQTVNKWVKDNAVVRLLQMRYMQCTYCDQNYYVQLKQLETDLDKPAEVKEVVNIG